MSSLKTPALLLALGSLAFLAGRATTSAQDPAADPAMAAYMEANKPGKFHRMLDVFVGTFDAKMTAWTDPEAEPVAGSGTMTNSWVLDGKYLRQEFAGNMSGMNMKGLAFWGYSTAEKTYQMVWLDSMGTTMSYSTGQSSPDGKIHTMVSKETDPVSGQTVDVKDVIKVQDKDHHTFTRYYVLPDGQEMKGFQIEYSRKG